MPRHEEKSCPRCNAPFECKSGDIGQCQCWGITLNDAEKRHIEERYEDCLCRSCLLELKNGPALFAEKFLGQRLT